MVLFETFLAAAVRPYVAILLLHFRASNPPAVYSARQSCLTPCRRLDSLGVMHRNHQITGASWPVWRAARRGCGRSRRPSAARSEERTASVSSERPDRAHPSRSLHPPTAVAGAVASRLCLPSSTRCERTPQPCAVEREVDIFLLAAGHVAHGQMRGQPVFSEPHARRSKPRRSSLGDLEDPVARNPTCRPTPRRRTATTPAVEGKGELADHGRRCTHSAASLSASRSVRRSGSPVPRVTITNTAVRIRKGPAPENNGLCRCSPFGPTPRSGSV